MQVTIPPSPKTVTFGQVILCNHHRHPRRRCKMERSASQQVVVKLKGACGTCGLPST